MVSLPIPNTKYEDIEGYFFQYDLNNNYKNYKLKVKINDSFTLYELRQMIEK